MTKEKITQDPVNFWLDLRQKVEDLLHYANPDKLLDILEMVYDAYIDSELANDIEERRAASIEYGIFRDILKTLRKHSVNIPADLPRLPLNA